MYAAVPASSTGASARTAPVPRRLGPASRGRSPSALEAPELLREAVATLEGTPARLEHARALTDLGAALRRSKRRVEAREHLRASPWTRPCAVEPQRSLSGRGPSSSLRAFAPRRLVLSGVEALTPSESRIAVMAADGMTNREIAQALFVTLRTVEGHLTHVYQKLGIETRDQLPDLLGDATARLSVTDSYLARACVSPEVARSLLGRPEERACPHGS